MKSSKLTAFLSALIAAIVCADAPPEANAGAPTAGGSDAATDVIVILRDQLPAIPATRDLRAARMAALATSRAPIIAELQRAQAANVRPFNMINAVAATVSKAEAARLAAHPLVQSVVPDTVIRLPKHSRPAARETDSGRTAADTGAAVIGSGALCNTLEPEALQLTHTAFLDPSVPQAQELVDGQGNKITGRGVRVAFIADGLDPTLAGFVRPDGTSAFLDYQDFSGDPAGTPTDGGEAFGDSSSIAAQDYPNGKLLTFNLDAFVIPNYPLPSPCNIRIRGMAPGALLVGLKAFSNLGYTTTSSFVQAIEYAVLKDDVDVINESFSSFYYPDNDNDPVSLANKAAVDAGVTVVGITYDGGATGTFESSGTDPWMIAVGASTQYRLYAQTSAPAGSLTPGSAGYLDDNISPLSSGGFAQTGTRTVDVVAPGDLGWALCSTNQTLYTDCFNNQFNPTPIEEFGGTSESAPLTSGEAALIIQAYRSTHAGASPSPALVKRIIMSTATDLGAPVDEQGAGLINALAAVQLALTVNDGNGGAHGPGGLLLDPTSAGFTGQENAEETASFTITNSGAAAQRVVPHLQTLGAPFAGATLSLNLNAAKAPQFVDPYGNENSYITKKFTVPSGAQYLDVAIAWPGVQGSTQYVQMALLDPSGRLASYSIPQGPASNYGRVDVVHPAAGVWTAIVYTYAPEPPGYTYSGPLQLTWAASRYVDFGQISPASLELKPGASATFTAKLNMPAAPGDLGAAIHFDSQGGAATPGDIPVTLRTLIPIGATGGSFTGTLSGGNGRAGIAPTQIFAFDVPSGLANMDLTVSVADNGYSLLGLLVAPNGMQASVAANIDLSGNPQYGLQLSHFTPQSGQWRLILLQNYNSSGNQTSLPFTARVGFNSARITAPTLPDGSGVHLSAGGAPLVVPIRVTNTGPATAAYFVDARLRTTSIAALTGTNACGFTTLPGLCTEFVLPTEVKGVEFTAASPVPITMDAYADVIYGAAGYVDSPDIYAKKIGAHTVAATLSEAEVPYGPWIVDPALTGPYGPAGAFAAPVTTGAKVTLLEFDPAISSDSGDFWADQTLGTSTYNPLILAPGESGTIHATINPDPSRVGQVVQGYLFIDTYNPLVTTGDEVVRLPYSYTIAP
jgi:Subtilase family